MNCSVIIPFKISDESRKRNLLFCIDYYKKYFDNIILVEQDKKSKISFDDDKLTHIFCENKNEFNRSWGFNVGAKIAIEKYQSSILLFCDADIILNHNAIINSMFNIMYCGCVAVNPYATIYHITKEQADCFVDNKSFEYIKNYCKVTGKPSFCGGACFIESNTFIDICGWDEDYIGWGGEDNAMTYTIQQLYKEKMKTENTGVAVHVYHEPVKNKKDNDCYRDNLDRCRNISKIGIKDYMNKKKSREIGDVNKYSK